ncbi:MAG: winged helix-turn-helix domain-containing protein [Ardenticatenaceae bacterium]|nr:winged helix-turn-helix domain-containing protein [Ardenticatenaceae bacterium]MCB9444234.1 winged helix-turn-helix domain-containing protein [Ardenticatenaceae bacterium]
MTDLSIWLLGPFQVELFGEPVTSFSSDKVRALLAYLAAEADRPHRRDKLAGLLWSNSPQQTARTNLRRALADLRKAIGDHQADPPYLLITRQTIQFNGRSGAWIDTAVFTQLTAVKIMNETVQRLEDAIALYRGCFMEGFFLNDSLPFGEWALLQRERYQRQALALLHSLATHYEERGAYERALNYAWQQVELDPFQEPAQWQLIRLLAFTGQRVAALSQYESFKQLLAKELNVKPEVKTSHLRQQIQEKLLMTHIISSGLVENLHPR